MEKELNIIERATEFLKKIDHALNYVIVLVWLSIPIALIIKLIKLIIG